MNEEEDVLGGLHGLNERVEKKIEEEKKRWEEMKIAHEKKIECTKCGQVYVSHEVPKICPICGTMWTPHARIKEMKIERFHTYDPKYIPIEERGWGKVYTVVFTDGVKRRYMDLFPGGLAREFPDIPFFPPDLEADESYQTTQWKEEAWVTMEGYAYLRYTQLFHKKPFVGKHFWDWLKENERELVGQWIEPDDYDWAFIYFEKCVGTDEPFDVTYIHGETRKVFQGIRKNSDVTEALEKAGRAK